jgi:hypothetical protein
MRSISFGFVLFSAATIVGCGGPSADQAAAAKPSPVGGAMVRFPHDAGFVAINTETAGPSRAAKTKPRETKIVAVFFTNDGSTPMTPPPTDVVFELESLPSKTGKPSLNTVSLEADPATPNRFVSAAGSFPGGVAGKIRVKIQGQDFEESFSAR